MNYRHERDDPTDSGLPDYFSDNSLPIQAGGVQQPVTELRVLGVAIFVGSILFAVIFALAHVLIMTVLTPLVGVFAMVLLFLAANQHYKANEAEGLPSYTRQEIRGTSPVHPVRKWNETKDPNRGRRY